jgi:hypothetical protein
MMQQEEDLELQAGVSIPNCRVLGTWPTNVSYFCASRWDTVGSSFSL